MFKKQLHGMAPIITTYSNYNYRLWRFCGLWQKKQAPLFSRLFAMIFVDSEFLSSKYAFFMAAGEGKQFHHPRPNQGRTIHWFQQGIDHKVKKLDIFQIPGYFLFEQKNNICTKTGRSNAEKFKKYDYRMVESFDKSH